jgi:hypothetical protein
MKPVPVQFSTSQYEAVQLEVVLSQFQIRSE